jgi:hypothetical protein
MDRARIKTGSVNPLRCALCALVVAVAAPLVASSAFAQGAPPAGRSATGASQVRPGRLVGVFDFDTGEPVVGAKVLDMRTGMSAVTTSTGTLSLFFVDTAGSLVQVGKFGYESQRFFVANAVTDTAGITVLLKASGQSLPTVVTQARGSRGPADTVRVLELNGFYDRRNTTGAPAGAFVTSERIEKLSLLKYLGTISGRAICGTNLYINGVKVAMPNLITPNPPMGNRRLRVIVAPPQRDGLDALLTPSEVLGVEMYKTADIPAEFNTTRPSSCGATLIWTK